MSSEISSKISQIAKRILYSSVLKVAGIYAFANFANASIPFFLLPVMTRYLTPEDYGIVATCGVLIGIYMPLINLHTSYSINIKYFKMSQNEFPQYVSNCLLITVVSCLILLLVSVIFSVQIGDMSSFPSDWLWAAIVVAFCGSIIQMRLFILQAAIKPYPYAATQFFQTILNAGLSIWFIVWLHMSWQGRIIAQVITAVVFLFASIILLYKNGWLVFKYNFNYIKDAVKFGVPLITSTICGFALFLADRLIITKIIGLSEAGIYYIGLQFVMIIQFIITSFNNAYSPWLFNKLNTATKQAKSKIVLMSYGYMVILLILTIIASFFMPAVIKIFIGEKFYGATQIIFWAFLAQVFLGMALIMWNFINYAERTRLVSLTEIFISLFHFICCYLLVKENGIIGAAQALAVTYFIRFLFMWIVSNKVYPMPWLSFYKDIYPFR